MSGLVLSGGTLLSVLQGKKVYQPIWQIITTNSSQANGNPSSQILLSDGKHLTYNAILHPNCHLTFDKSQWKNHKKLNAVGRIPEETLAAYRFAFIKVTEYLVQKRANTSVIFLSKLKLLGCEKYDKAPDILNHKDVEVILGNCEVVTRSREGLEQFDLVPAIEINKINDYDDAEGELDYKFSVGGNRPSLLEEFSAQSLARAKYEAVKEVSQSDLYYGDLAPLGPSGLNILRLCEKCSSLTYVTDSTVSTFRPSAESLLESLAEILPNNHRYKFCCCDEENDQFRKEFQNKCMVVNQDNSSTGQERKVQCILVSKEASGVLSGGGDDNESIPSFKGSHSTRALTNGKNGSGYESNEGISTMVSITKKTARVSSKLRLCEHCGVEERDMSACKHCAKVWYCSANCKKADVKPHTAVCRAYITVRRYQEEKAEFARKINEPDDGCGTCGFWRESLQSCNKCGKVSYCSYRCKDKAAEKHRPVCEALTVIENYRRTYMAARSQEVD